MELQEKDENKHHRLQLLAARALCDFQLTKRDETVVSIARERLYHLIQSESILEERFHAGVLLGDPGDNRIKEDNMVVVTNGEFIRGSNKIKEAEKPGQRIYLDDFLIAKYPVTNQEFKKFIVDNEYHRKESWTEEGWRWRQEYNVNATLYWYERIWNGPNFPIVGISWYEVAAYANWLSKVTGKSYRIPTEAEWEKTARGTDGRIYPWENEFDKNLCNSYEYGLQRTSPVGIFIEGESPYGCMDLAGNVWEWCADWYDEKYYHKSPLKNPTGPTTGSTRILRGGSWSNTADSCASAIRSYARPESRSQNIGFRLARSF